MANETLGSSEPVLNHTSGDNGASISLDPAAKDEEAGVVLPPTTSQPNESNEHEQRYSVFSSWEKRIIVLASATTAFFSPMTAQIYFPALPTLAEYFNVSDSQINLTVTTYMIFQGITPMFIGSLADTGGRRPAYVICFVVYIAANIGLALSQNYASLLVIRCIQSAGSSSTVALCSAVVADIVTSAERGEYIGYTVIPIVLAPAIGPVVGGALAQYLGWRSIFWFLTILAGITLLLLLFFFPETNRRIVGDGSIRPPVSYMTLYQIIKARLGKDDKKTPPATGDKKHFLRFRDINPLASLKLLFQRENGLILGYGSIVMAGFYAVAAALPSQFSSRYGYSELTIGLLYLPIAGGSVASAAIVSPMVNWNFRRYCAKAGIPFDKSKQQDLTDFPIEKARLEVGLPLLGLATIVMASWGWAIEAQANIAVPVILMFLLGMGLVGLSNTYNTLIVDLNRKRAGAATAANNVTRCLVGAASSYAIIPMITGIGVGWAFTLIALLYLVFLPALLAPMKWGIQWRKQEKEKIEAMKKKEQEKAQPKIEEGKETGVVLPVHEAKAEE